MDVSKIVEIFIRLNGDEARMLKNILEMVQEADNLYTTEHRYFSDELATMLGIDLAE